METYETAKDFPYVDGLPNSIFKLNRQRFIADFKARQGDSFNPNSIAIFKGYSEVPLYNSDVNYHFHQEGNFYFLFGVVEPDCYAVIDFKNEEAILFPTLLSNLYKIWMTVLDQSDFEKKYEMKSISSEELEQWVKDRKPEIIHLNGGVNSDSDLPNMIPEEKYWSFHSNVDKESLYQSLANVRATKTDEEIDVMRWATKITVEGHILVMQKIKAGMREVDLESIFKAYCEQTYKCNRQQPYIPIVGCGCTAATLHYNDNNKLITDGSTMLIDQAHQVHHYCSDITTCFPVNGKFTKKQAEIYSIVLKANREVMKNMKPGVSWVEMHLLAERVTLTGLKELGLIDGDIDEMLEARLGYIFQPHGLGHLLGLEVHEVGGYLNHTPERTMKPGLKSLRTSRLLEKGMVITVEPGCYFRDFLLDGKMGEGLKIDLKYLNREKIREYQSEINGVRIEDVVLVTEEGCENLSGGLPRTVEEIEKCMAGQKWN